MKRSKADHYLVLDQGVGDGQASSTTGHDSFSRCWLFALRLSMGVRSSHASAGSQQQAWSCLDRAFVRSHAHCGASPDAVTVDLGINGFVASQPITQS